MFITALFTIDKVWKQPKCPSAGEQIKKMRYTHTFTHGILFGLKKEGNPARCDLEGIMRCEISQIEKDKYCMISLICGVF